MIAGLALRLIGWGVPARFGKAAAIGLLVALAIAAICAVVAIRDSRMIEAHDAKRDATELRGQVEREHKADTGELAARKVDQEQAEQMKGAIDNAVQAQPEAARRGAGPATNRRS